ncbi:hypothetical protein [Rhizobium leguminosarum]|nr:hypothetical protein [Rhizobium leguminosarum]
MTHAERGGKAYTPENRAIALPRRKTTTTQGKPYFLTPECEITFEAGSAE